MNAESPLVRGAWRYGRCRNSWQDDLRHCGERESIAREADPTYAGDPGTSMTHCAPTH